MKMLRNAIVICAALVLASAALAQGGGRGQGMMMMGGDSSGTMLLQRADVQKDLGITDDQKSKLTAMQEKARTDMREIFQNANGDRDAMRAAFTKYAEQMKKDVGGVLTKEQTARLKEINIQLAGNSAAAFPDVQTALGLTADQIAKIKDLGTKQQEANGALMQKVQDGEMTREEVMAARTKNGETYKTEIGKILTDDQKAKLKTMGGKEFKADKPSGGGL
jgi:protein CpxP